jgi:hypothetical protein
MASGSMAEPGSSSPMAGGTAGSMPASDKK